MKLKTTTGDLKDEVNSQHGLFLAIDNVSHIPGEDASFAYLYASYMLRFDNLSIRVPSVGTPEWHVDDLKKYTCVEGWARPYKNADSMPASMLQSILLEPKEPRE